MFSVKIGAQDDDGDDPFGDILGDYGLKPEVKKEEEKEITPSIPSVVVEEDNGFGNFDLFEKS